MTTGSNCALADDHQIGSASQRTNNQFSVVKYTRAEHAVAGDAGGSNEIVAFRGDAGGAGAFILIQQRAICPQVQVALSANRATSVAQCIGDQHGICCTVDLSTGVV